MDAEKLKVIGDRAQELSKLKKHPSWPVLREIFEGKKNQWFGSLARSLMAGQLVDQREIDRKAGFFAGAEWILDNPDMAEASLNRALKKAQTLEELSEA